MFLSFLNSVFNYRVFLFVQDTVIALEALSKMTDKAPESKFSPVDVEVSWNSDRISDGIKTSSVTIDQDNVLIPQRIDLLLQVVCVYV